MPNERTSLQEAGVGVGVEVNQGELAESVSAGDAHRVWPGDGVVAAKHDRHLSCLGNESNGIGDFSYRLFHLPGRHHYVADVNDTEHLKRI